MTASTPDLIDHLVELREKATPGPWQDLAAKGGRVFTVVAGSAIYKADRSDIAFIIALVNAFPALAARLAEVEGENANLTLLLRDLQRSSAIIEDRLAEFGSVVDGQEYDHWNATIDAASGYLAKDSPDPINEEASYGRS